MNVHVPSIVVFQDVGFAPLNATSSIDEMRALELPIKALESPSRMRNKYAAGSAETSGANSTLVRLPCVPSAAT